MSDDKRAQESAEATLEHIKEAMAKKDEHEEAMEMPLSVEVRSDWESIGSELKPAEFSILLSTGGPAVRILGKLDDRGYPYHPEIQHQDWFTPWEPISVSDEDAEVLQSFVELFIYPY